MFLIFDSSGGGGGGGAAPSPRMAPVAPPAPPPPASGGSGTVVGGVWKVTLFAYIITIIITGFHLPIGSPQKIESLSILVFQCSAQVADGSEEDEVRSSRRGEAHACDDHREDSCLQWMWNSHQVHCSINIKKYMLPVINIHPSSQLTNWDRQTKIF